MAARAKAKELKETYGDKAINVINEILSLGILYDHNEMGLWSKDWCY